MNKYKNYIIGLFCLILFGALLLFYNKDVYSHKINTGTIKAKVIVPARTELRGNKVYVIPKTFVFMVKKDTITEKFEVNEEIYYSYRVGEEFSIRK